MLLVRSGPPDHTIGMFDRGRGPQPHRKAHQDQQRRPLPIHHMIARRATPSNSTITAFTVTQGGRGDWSQLPARGGSCSLEAAAAVIQFVLVFGP